MNEIASERRKDEQTMLKRSKEKCTTKRSVCWCAALLCIICINIINKILRVNCPGSGVQVFEMLEFHLILVTTLCPQMRKYIVWGTHPSNESQTKFHFLFQLLFLSFPFFLAVLTSFFFLFSFCSFFPHGSFSLWRIIHMYTHILTWCFDNNKCPRNRILAEK